MIKVKLKKFLAITMALSMVFSTNAFATPIDLATSTENITTDTLDKDVGTDYFTDETTNVWNDGSILEEVRVNVKRTSFFDITIPKEIVLNGNNGSANYEVSVTGELAGDQSLVVKPDDSFTLTEDGGKTTPVTVTQDKDTFNYQNINNNEKGNGTLSAPGISAGNWSGSFYFNIEFKAETCEHDYVGTLTKEATETENGEMTYTCSKCGKVDRVESVAPSFSTMSWAAISNVSEKGNAASTFAVGDEKELQIGSETYHVQILGFNHDAKSDGTGKAGITVGLKEVMTTEKAINSSGSNAGGWKDSDMRTYLNEIVHNSLPNDLQAVIKTVDKISDIGNPNYTLNTTEDKLFLLSAEEVGFTKSNNSCFVAGQGTKYEYFTDDNSRIKYLSGDSSDWWLRSANTAYTAHFFIVFSDGDCNHYHDGADSTSGVVFGFSI